jgi:hypothetical protein
MLAAATGPAVRGGEPVSLTSAATVRALSASEAAGERPVRIEGVVLTIVDWPAFVLWDETDGIYLTASPPVVANLQPGAWVAIEGTTGPGNFAPMIKAARVQRLGTKPLPEPLHTSVTEVAGGGFDAKWVEVEGIVRSCVTGRIGPVGFEDAIPDDASGVLPRESTFLTLASGDVLLRIKASATLNPAALVDARVRLRGVCFNVHNANRQFVRASLRVPGADALTVIAPPPSDPFALPVRRAASLLQFDPSGFTGHRVQVRGVVTRRQADNVLWIRDGDRGLRIVSAEA